MEESWWELGVSRVLWCGVLDATNRNEATFQSAVEDLPRIGLSDMPSFFYANKEDFSTGLSEEIICISFLWHLASTSRGWFMIVLAQSKDRYSSVSYIFSCILFISASTDLHTVMTDGLFLSHLLCFFLPEVPLYEARRLFMMEV